MSIAGEAELWAPCPEDAQGQPWPPDRPPPPANEAFRPDCNRARLPHGQTLDLDDYDALRGLGLRPPPAVTRRKRLPGGRKMVAVTVDPHLMHRPAPTDPGAARQPRWTPHPYPGRPPVTGLPDMPPDVLRRVRDAPGMGGRALVLRSRAARLANSLGAVPRHR